MERTGFYSYCQSETWRCKKPRFHLPVEETTVQTIYLVSTCATNLPPALFSREGLGSHPYCI